ncbi:MAG TPA: hypothetical protein VJU59_44280 [Paraburkholderia sp.]|uniref:hypothetical protein n=1 Tax=Paraburkholderia sp. TaxID=1926495 RepID=UPI002B498635|nr:hypothetical protein [Paraburkholderia sp.]HKR46608.1 hypothetical protein [Paraburkholderia sp.]
MRTTLEYCVITSFALVAGFASMVVCGHVREHTAQLTATDWPQAGLGAAAAAALAFQEDHGRLPDSLDELRTTRSGPYLPRGFDLKGVLYFRDGGGRPRLSWRDDVDRDAAFCTLDAALHKHC